MAFNIIVNYLNKLYLTTDSIEIDKSNCQLSSLNRYAIARRKIFGVGISGTLNLKGGLFGKMINLQKEVDQLINNPGFNVNQQSIRDIISGVLFNADLSSEMGSSYNLVGGFILNRYPTIFRISYNVHQGNIMIDERDTSFSADQTFYSSGFPHSSNCTGYNISRNDLEAQINDYLRQAIATNNVSPVLFSNIYKYIEDNTKALVRRPITLHTISEHGIFQDPIN